MLKNRPPLLRASFAQQHEEKCFSFRNKKQTKNTETKYKSPERITQIFSEESVDLLNPYSSKLTPLVVVVHFYIIYYSTILCSLADSLCLLHAALKTSLKDPINSWAG